MFGMSKRRSRLSPMLPTEGERCQIKACKSQEDSARADPFHPRPRHTLVFSSRLSQLKWLALHFSLPLCNPTDVTSTLCTRAREKTIAERRRYRRHGERWLEPPNRDVVACRSQESTTCTRVLRTKDGRCQSRYRFRLI